MSNKMKFNEKTDLILERTLDVPRSAVWEAWTTPTSMTHWFCPKPWTAPTVEMDLRPGGKFRTVMRSPEGQEHDNTGCFLHIEKGTRLVWTDMLTEDFHPAASGGFMTAALVLEDAPGGGTKYTAYAFHRTPEDKATHEKMGFKEGWGTVVDQLVAHIKSGQR